MAANRRLHQLKEQLHTNRETNQTDHEKPWFDEDLSLPESGLVEGGGTAVMLISHLPDHLGWESDVATKTIRIARQQHQQEQSRTMSSMADLRSSSTSNGKEQQGQPLPFSSKQQADHQLHLPFKSDTIKHYPSIGIAALKEEQASIYRVWLMCRYLDRDGRGWLDVQDVQEQLTDTESKLRLFTWRRLRQVLGQGHGRFWIWDKEHDRLWLFGAARVAANLDVSRLIGKPVALPVSVITAGIGEFKAHLYGAWHSGRKINNPISRTVQETITGIPERTQRHYCRVARIRSKPNIAIGSKHKPEEVEKQAWQRGRATFELVDHQGQQGRKGYSYVAWHLPNTYIGPHQQTTKGRMRKINRKLNVLVNKGTQGNRQGKVVKRYFADGKDAVQALDRDEVLEVYWPMTAVSKLSTLWAVFFWHESEILCHHYQGNDSFSISNCLPICHPKYQYA